MEYIISDKAYKTIKWAVLIVLPAAATLFSALAAAWGMDAQLAQAIVTTITAVSAFGGAVLGVSAATARQAQEGQGDEDA